MKESKKPRKLYYENDTLSLSFDFYFEGLMIAFTNKSKDSINIKWNELRMTENEIDKKIQHTTISDGKIIAYEPPSNISPEAGYADLAVYADNIYYLKESDEELAMKIKDNYPRTSNKKARDSILKLKGQRVTLLFTIEVKNVPRSWVFNFLLEDIKSKREVTWGTVAGVVLTPLSSIQF